MSQSHIRIPESTAPRDDIVHCAHDEIDVIRGWFTYLSPTWKMYACGHRDHRRYSLNVYGEIHPFDEAFFSKALRCANCQVEWLKGNSIRCFRCGHIIQDGEAVAEYRYLPQPIPRYAMAIMEEGGYSFLGCCREGCMFFDTTSSGKWATNEGYTPFAPGSASIPTMLMHQYFSQHISSRPPKNV